MNDKGQHEFNSRDVNFDSNKISLKRNKFTYATLNYNDVNEIMIFKGYLLKNRLLVILGAFCLMWLGYSILNTGYNLLHDKELSTYEWLNQFFNKGSIASVWGPFLLILMGLLAIYNTFNKSYIAKIKTNDKTYYPRIKEIEKRQEVDLLTNFLKMKNIKIYKESTRA
ncbi:MAG: hypothetical protein N4A71_06270 [Carboxylicivirga sp.]|jgi:hypothetical protein|nr:hypothetical protein [Carboxylicivirga sp.]